MPLWPTMLRRAAGTRRRRRPLGGRRRVEGMSGFGRSPPAPAAGRRGIVALVLVPRLPAPLRPRPACRTTTRCSAARSCSSSGSRSPSSFSSASIDAGGATSRCTTCGALRAASWSPRSSPSVTVYLVSPVHNVRLPRSIAVMDLLDHAGADRRCPAARADGDRASPLGGMIARGREVIVVGAGDAGRAVVAEMQRSRMLRYTPIGFVDDDPAKKKIAHSRRPGARNDG